MEYEAMFSPANLCYNIRASIEQNELLSAFNQREFMAQVWRQIAAKVADKVLQQVGPAIDKALKEMSKTDEDE